MTEQEDKATDDLLEMLTDQLKCTYLSDLKTPEHKQAIYNVLTTVSAEEYSLAQWNEALSYLCGGAYCDSRQCARDQLLEMCL